jgi:hypothetical protein
MVLLMGREWADVSDADIAVGWKLQPAVETMVNKRERNMMWHLQEEDTDTQTLEPTLPYRDNSKTRVLVDSAPQEKIETKKRARDTLTSLLAGLRHGFDLTSFWVPGSIRSGSYRCSHVQHASRSLT